MFCCVSMFGVGYLLPQQAPGLFLGVSGTLFLAERQLPVAGQLLEQAPHVAPVDPVPLVWVLVTAPQAGQAGAEGHAQVQHGHPAGDEADH